MEKDLFIKVLAHYSDSSEEEAAQVLSLSKNYPYSQILQTLAARLSKDHNFEDHSAALQRAAVYAADRSVLKDVMTLNQLAKVNIQSDTAPPRVVPKQDETLIKDEVPGKKEQQEVNPFVVQSAVAPPNVDEIIKDDDRGLAEEVMDDLEKLHEAKHRFEMMFEKSENSGTFEAEVLTTSAGENTEALSEIADDNDRDTPKSKKERIIELVKAMEESKDTVPGEEEVKPKRKREGPPETLMEEIINKDALEPEGPALKEQMATIDEFIKTQPTIVNVKDRPIVAPAGDLSTIRTGEFSDNIVSETLVEILLKQGKKEKAIEVLKKLIWKFPQKKAYFAAQIEDLKSS